MNVILIVISMSISASIMFLLYLAVRRVLQKLILASALYALMIIIVLRLLIPYSPEFSLMNNLPDILQPFTADAHSHDAFNQVQEDTSNSRVSAETEYTHGGKSQPYNSNQAESTPVLQYVEDTNGANQKQTEQIPLHTLVISVWLIGTILAICFNITAYRLCRKKILMRAHLSEIHTQILSDIAGGTRYPNVFISPTAGTPMLLGLLKPVIVLPNEYYGLDELENILRHELCHYRRFDIVFKWTAVVARSLHWFNPLMPILCRELDDICEFSCDEAVTRRMNSAERRAYIRTLLKTASRQVNSNTLPLSTMSGSAKRINERFTAIANQKYLTPSRAALSIAAVISLTAIGMCLGACTSFRDRQNLKDNTDLQYKNDINNGSVNNSNTNIFPSNSTLSDSYACYQYGYEAMRFEIVDSNASDVENNKVLRISNDGSPYECKPTLIDSTKQRVIMRSMLNLLNYEKYERIDEVEDIKLFTRNAIQVDFYNELFFYLEEGGNMFVWLDFNDITEFPHSREYPDYLESPGSISVFKVPDDLYGRAASMLYPMAEQSAEEATAEKLKRYPFEDIDNDFIYAVLSSKIRIISDDYGCDFYAEVGSHTYDLVWNLFKGIWQCEQIQAHHELDKTDSHIMIIGPEDYGEKYVGEYITIYGDSGVICARFKGDEIWYSVPKQLVKMCEEIAGQEK